METFEVPPHTAKMPTVKTTESTRCWQAVEKLEPSCIANGNANRGRHCGRQSGSPSKRETQNYQGTQQFHSLFYAQEN